MIRGMRHVGLVVVDLDLALRFYIGILGLTEVSRAEESGVALETMLGVPGASAMVVKLMAPDGSMLELLRFDHQIAPRPQNIVAPGFTHVAFTVDRLDLLHKELSAWGIRFLGAPICSGGYRVAFALDPEGNAVELVEPLQ